MPQRRIIFDGTDIIIRNTEHSAEMLRLAMESISATTGARGSAVSISVNDANYVIKEYFRGGLISFLKNRHLSHNQLQNEVEIIDYLRLRGFDVPEIAAAITVRKFPWSRYILITKRIDSARPLTYSDIADSKTLKNLCASVRRLHEVGVCHGDLNLTNILYDGSKFYFIDFANSRFTFDEKRHKHDIFRLIRSIEKIMGAKLGPSAKARILRYYYRGKKNIRKLVRQYNIHSIGHKLSWKVLGKS